MTDNNRDSTAAAIVVGSDGRGGASDSNSVTRAAWTIAKPERHDYAIAVTELNSACLVGEGGIFERGPHVPVTHMGYFKPRSDAFLNEFRSRDRRSTREWEYLDDGGVWTELGLTAFDVAKKHGGTIEDLTRRLGLAGDAMKATVEVLSMRAQYFRDITEQGVEIAKQMSFLIEQGHDAVFSESYRSARTALTSEMESEAARMLAKAWLKRASNKGGCSSGAATEE